MRAEEEREARRQQTARYETLAHMERQCCRCNAPKPEPDTIYLLQMGSGRGWSERQGEQEGTGGGHSSQPSGGPQGGEGQAGQSSDGAPRPAGGRARELEAAKRAGRSSTGRGRDAGSNSHEFARIRIRPEIARIRVLLRTRIHNFKFESSLIRLIASTGTYNLPSRLQFTCLHMGMPLPSTISHKRFPKSFRNLAIFGVCCCLHLPC